MLRYLFFLFVSISFLCCSGNSQDNTLSDITTTLNSTNVYLKIYNQDNSIYYEMKMDDVNVLSSSISGAKKRIAKIPAYYWIECKKNGQIVLSIGFSEDCNGFKCNGVSFIIDNDRALELICLFNQIKTKRQTSHDYH